MPKGGEPVYIPPFGDCATIDTGVHIAIPQHFCGLVKSRSGLMVHNKIVTDGTICLCGYEGDSFDAAEQRMNQIMDVGFLPFAMLFRDESGTTKKEWRQFQREWANSYIVGKKFREREGLCFISET